MLLITQQNWVQQWWQVVTMWTIKNDVIFASTTQFFFNSHSGWWSPNGSSRHVGHWMAYCTCPGWLWWWRIWWNEDWQGKPKYSEKTCPSATLSTTNPTWPDRGLNTGRRGGKPATNNLSYGAASTTQLYFHGHHNRLFAGEVVSLYVQHYGNQASV
jgi:hypothetical protein